MTEPNDLNDPFRFQRGQPNSKQWFDSQNDAVRMVEALHEHNEVAVRVINRLSTITTRHDAEITKLKIDNWSLQDRVNRLTFIAWFAGGWIVGNAVFNIFFN